MGSPTGAEIGMGTDKVKTPKVERSSCPARVFPRRSVDDREAAKGRTDDAADATLSDDRTMSEQ
jgi:hypothetical protein